MLTVDVTASQFARAIVKNLENKENKSLREQCINKQFDRELRKTVKEMMIAMK